MEKVFSWIWKRVTFPFVWAWRWFIETKFSKFFIEAGRRIKNAWRVLRGKE